MERNLFKTVNVLIIFLLTSVDLLAQAASSTQHSAISLLEEVAVTARKRSGVERIQDIPLSISAFGQQQMDALYLKNFRDLSFIMPSVQTDEVGTFPGVQNFTIRGQGINSSIPSVDPTVGLFIDGMFLGVSYGTVTDIFDLESIEVLRGPQGVLFGRNVTGGAILMKTKRASGDFGVDARMRLSTGPEKNLALSVENALTDHLAAKLVLYWNDDDGYWDSTTTSALPVPDGARFRVADGEKLGQRTDKFIRANSVWNVNDRLAMDVVAEIGRSKGDGSVWTLRELVQNGSLANDESTQDEVGFSDIEWQHVIWQSTWEVYSGQLTNIAAYRDISSDARSDIDGRQLPIFNAGASTEQDQISNELRYAWSSANERWDSTLGLYYFQQDIVYRENRYVFINALSTVLNTVNLGGDLDHSTWGLFVSTDYHINSALSLNAGLRYTREKKQALIVNADPAEGGAPCRDLTFALCQFDRLEDTWNNVTPKVGIDWSIADNASVYAFYTRGYRSGGVNFRNALPGIIDPGPTEEEKQDAVELGFKSEFFDGKGRFNGALYHVRISDMQRELNVGAELFDPVVTSGVIVWQATANVGDVDITGAELETIGLLTDNLSLSATLSYVDNEYKSKSQTILEAEAAAGITLLGQDLPRLAAWTGSIGINYDLVLNRLGQLHFRFTYAYRDPAAYNDSNTQIFTSKRDVNASIKWQAPNQQWTASVFGKNLNDEVQWGSLTSIAGFTTGAATKGRTFGVEVSYHY